MPADQIEHLLAPKEVGEILSLRRSKIHRMITAGEIPSVIVSKGTRRRVFRVRPSDLLKWMKEREVSNAR
jgi:excisionase family DNA binding protein